MNEWDCVKKNSHYKERSKKNKDNHKKTCFLRGQHAYARCDCCTNHFLSSSGCYGDFLCRVQMLHKAESTKHPVGDRTHYSSETSLLSIPTRRDVLISESYGGFTEAIVSFSLRTIQVGFCVLQISPV